jgi:hypothetical protein
MATLIGRPSAPAQAHPASADLHRSLARLNQRRLEPLLGDAQWRAGLAEETALRLAEDGFVAAERSAVATRAAHAPRDAAGFVRWFEGLAATGPGQGDPLFPWLAERATLAEMRWFLAQEVAGEAGFDDLLALVQPKLPTRARLEVARNLWDEMGRGQAIGMHGPMLARLAGQLELDTREPVWEAQALANLMVALCANRRFAYQGLGAIGVIELTAPSRVGLVDEGLERLGISAVGRRYFSLHATIDVAHGRAWIAEVIAPLVAEDPRRATAIAEGALMRLEAGRRCFARYRLELGIA